MTQYLDPSFVFNGQTSYSKSELDQRFRGKANWSQVYTKLEVDERVGTIGSNFVSISSQLASIQAQLTSGVVPTLFTGIDGNIATQNIQLKREVVAYERPVAGDLLTGEVSIGTNENSPFLYTKDDTGAVRRIAGIQFGTALPDGTTYVQGTVSTYAEQRTRGEQFFNTTSEYTYIFDGTSWVIQSYGSEAIRESDLPTAAGNVLSVFDISDVVNPGGSGTDGETLIWNSTTQEFTRGLQAVLSVNGDTGTIVLDVDDIDDSASATRKYLTPAERTKLTGIETGATADQTATEIRDSLASLAGVNRLDASAIKNIPASVTSVNGASGTVVLTTDNISDSTATNKYINSIFTGNSQLVATDNSGAIFDLSEPTTDSKLVYDGTTSPSIRWKAENVYPVENVITTTLYALTKEYTFIDPSGVTVNTTLPGASAPAGTRLVVKNTGTAGGSEVVVPSVEGLNTLSIGETITIIKDTNGDWQRIQLG